MSGLLEWAGYKPSLGRPGRPPGSRDKRRRDSSVRRLIAELEAEPGQWRRIAGYPPEREKSAWTRGSTTVRRHPELEYTVRRTADGGADLYLRIPPAYDGHTDTEEPKP